MYTHTVPYMNTVSSGVKYSVWYTSSTIGRQPHHTTQQPAATPPNITTSHQRETDEGRQASKQASKHKQASKERPGGHQEKKVGKEDTVRCMTSRMTT